MHSMDNCEQYELYDKQAIKCKNVALWTQKLRDSQLEGKKNTKKANEKVCN